MARASADIVLSCALEKAWDMVVNLDDPTWRRDISSIDIIDDNTFTETSIDGIVTTFTITAFVPLQRYAFDIDNKNMHGHWTGVFSEQNGKTHITIEEVIEVKHFIMKLFVNRYLKKQQKMYLEDLRKACEHC